MSHLIKCLYLHFIDSTDTRHCNVDTILFFFQHFPTASNKQKKKEEKNLLCQKIKLLTEKNGFSQNGVLVPLWTLPHLAGPSGTRSLSGNKKFHYFIRPITNQS